MRCFKDEECEHKSLYGQCLDLNEFYYCFITHRGKEGSGMYCPFKFSPRTLVFDGQVKLTACCCEEGFCALWDHKANVCCILSLTYLLACRVNLSDLGREVKIPAKKGKKTNATPKANRPSR